MYMLNEPPCVSVDQIALFEPWDTIHPHYLSLIFAISCFIQDILRAGIPWTCPFSSPATVISGGFKSVKGQT